LTQIVLGLDQGTSSTRCLAFDHELRQRGAASVAVSASFPGPGLVEQDPAELLASSSSAIAGALTAAAATLSDVVALGITNQTETFIVSERASGRPIYPAIVWQDRRTADRCAALTQAGHAPFVRARTGLELDATFPATKVGWVLDHVDGARAGAEAGELVYDDVASWLVCHLTGIHACEASNAGRTLLCPLGGDDWDDELLDLFGLPRALLPPIVDSDALVSLGRASAGPPSPPWPRRPLGRGSSRSVGPVAGGAGRPSPAAAPGPSSGPGARRPRRRSARSFQALDHAVKGSTEGGSTVH